MADSLTSNPRFTERDSPYLLVGEIERLTAELVAAKSDVQDMIAVRDEREFYLNAANEFRAERDRLRAALGRIANARYEGANCDVLPAKRIAREALAEVNAAYPIGYSESHTKRTADETSDEPFRGSWKCKAQRTADPQQDCDWPYCGCDIR